MMQLKHELKEVVEKGQHILQKMEGSMAQRMYGMRSNQGGYSGNSGGYNGQGGNYGNSGGYNGQGGNYGNRDNWQMNPMQQGFPQQGMFPQQGFQQYPQQDMMQQMNPLWFL